MFYNISSTKNYCVQRPHDAYVILSDKKNSTRYDDRFYSYSITIALDSRVQSGELYEVACWCEENCSDAWLVGCDISAFVNVKDAMAFKLRWV